KEIRQPASELPRRDASGRRKTRRTGRYDRTRPGDPDPDASLARTDAGGSGQAGRLGRGGLHLEKLEGVPRRLVADHATRGTAEVRAIRIATPDGEHEAAVGSRVRRHDRQAAVLP